ncbi:EEF1A lysine methyltransferase 1 isoform X2 [Silurus meridionalis]|uniref:EEF1A lysine methyltransferase 1 isoform X2 n=1 Tax=Silurus meridionalis TaxID=175797 RepID=UPI001EEC644E|nr:EEF1A lysine methyltransferase 1 isoform X2 [Silurus meridionalis]
MSGCASDEDDDVPQLSDAALAALHEFYAENEAGDSAHRDSYTVGAIKEDWRMSQFWYSDETATRLAEEAIQQAGKQGRIACISAPSVYQKLKQLESENVDGSHCVSAVLLEFDRRFTAYDPPYLSEECLSKVAVTVKYLTKSKILLCTGAIMEEHARKLMDVKICSYLPKHNHNLANEFRCYVNYESGLL